MRRIWSEQHKRKLWRKIWLALAETQMEYGLVSREQVDELRSHAEEIDLPRAMEIESEIHHDLMAELKAYAEQCPLGVGFREVLRRDEGGHPKCRTNPGLAALDKPIE